MLRQRHHRHTVLWEVFEFGEGENRSGPGGHKLIMLIVKTEAPTVVDIL